MTTVRVPASTSNLGAGFDFLGLALDLWLEARLVPGASPPVYRGTLEGLDPTRDLVMQLLGDACPRDHHVELVSDIPVSRGLGSSAAAVVAGLALRNLALGETPSQESIFDRGVQVEGHPDNVAPAVYGGLILIAERPIPLSLHRTLGVALAVPDIPVDTRRAREILPQTLPRDVVIEQARRAAALIQGLVGGDGELIAFGMEDQLAVPCRKSLIPGFERAVQAGQASGAYGVTISGSGSAVVAVAPANLAPAVGAALATALTNDERTAAPLTPGVSPTGFVTSPTA